MKIEISKEWLEKQAASEAGQNIEAGTPPTEREQWLAECRRLLVEKYDLKWEASEIAQYANDIAEQGYDDPDWRVSPDEAIQEEFQAGL